MLHDPPSSVPNVVVPSNISCTLILFTNAVHSQKSPGKKHTARFVRAAFVMLRLQLFVLA